MARNILLLNGSPHLHGNTSALCDAFVRGAETGGNKVVRFDLQGMNIHGCLGCMGGGKDPQSPCVQKDDMLRIYPAYITADLVVLASPMYYWGFSSQLKAAFDRLFAVAELNGDYRNPVRECMLLMSAEGDTPGNWKPVLNYYQALVEQLGWHDLGTVLAGGMLRSGDIFKNGGHEALKRAESLGASLK